MDATVFFRYIQEIITELEESGLPILIGDIPEELKHEELYDELNASIANFFAECIKQQPYGSTNPLLREAITFFESKGIRGQNIDKIILPEDEHYGWAHSILFFSLGANKEQSTILKNFGCSLEFDRAYITKLTLEGERVPLHKATVQLKIDHYNRIFPQDQIPSLAGGKRKSRKRKSRKLKF